MYLLDTNVVSETRKPKPHRGVMKWLQSLNAEDLRIAAIVVGEVQVGIERLRAHDTRKAAELDGWLGRILDSYDVLAMDAVTFRIWAKLMVGQQEHLYEDAMIAASAIQHNLTIATRNTRHMDLFGAATFDPFSYREA